MNPYTRKFTRRERVLLWLIYKLDAYRQNISERQWEKINRQLSHPSTKGKGVIR